MTRKRENTTILGTDPFKKFVWSGTDLCQERSVNNLLKKRFFAEGEQINGIYNYYFTRDHLGSIREMTDSGGAVSARYDYDPYGRRIKLSGTLEADFGFTGYYVHAPSGLQLALYRAYDADVGRWVNRDSIGERGGLNLYGYVANNPVNWIDLLGLQSWMPNPQARYNPSSSSIMNYNDVLNPPSTEEQMQQMANNVQNSSSYANLVPSSPSANMPFQDNTPLTIGSMPRLILQTHRMHGIIIGTIPR